MAAPAAACRAGGRDRGGQPRRQGAGPRGRGSAPAPPSGVALRAAVGFCACALAGAGHADGEVVSGSTVRLIGTGWARTGTTSIRKALTKFTKFALKPQVYHMGTVMKKPDLHASMWLEIYHEHAAGRPTAHLFRRLFEGYRVVCDWPASAWWREIIDAFPEAKVVHTSRPAEAWYNSTNITMFKYVKYIQTNDPEPLREVEATIMGNTSILEWVDIKKGQPLKIGHQDYGKMMQLAVWDRIFGEGIDPSIPSNQKLVMRAFEEHDRQVREALHGSSRFLTFRGAADGWQPLCAHLELPDCPDAEWPHAHSTRDFIRITFQKILNRRFRPPGHVADQGLRLLVTGLARTGTASLTMELAHLQWTNFSRVYDMGRLVLPGQQISRVEVTKWLEIHEEHAAGRSVRHLLRDMFVGVDVALGFPACAWWREISDAFPEAKIIHTSRPAEDWYASSLNTIFPYVKFAQDNEPGPLVELAQRFLNDEAFGAPKVLQSRIGKDFGRMMQLAVWDRLFGHASDPTLPSDRQRVIDAFGLHELQVRREFAGIRDFLEIRVSEEVTPLCAFLGTRKCPTVRFPTAQQPWRFLRQHLERRQLAPGGEKSRAFAKHTDSRALEL